MKLLDRLGGFTISLLLFCCSGPISARNPSEPIYSVTVDDRMRDACAMNLRKIYEAAKAYERERGELPGRLSDLAGEWIDPEALSCPVCRSSRTANVGIRGLINWMDDDPLTTYKWEYHPTMDPNQPNGRLARSAARCSPAGDSVPMARCDHHRFNTRENHLNLSFNGVVYSSSHMWEEAFVEAIPAPYLSPKMLAKNIRPIRARIPPREPTHTSAQIDLTDHWNALLSDPWFDGADDDTLMEIRNMGIESLAGITGFRFDVRGIVQLDGWVDKADAGANAKPINASMQGEAVLALPYSEYPQHALGMAVKRYAPKLAFLIGGIYPSPLGTEVAKLLIHYSDTRIVIVPLVYGEDLVDGWYDTLAPERQKMCLTKCVYTGPRGKKGYGDFSGHYVSRNGNILVFLKTWSNPFPAVSINHIDFLSSALGNAPAPTCPFLLGITVGTNEQ